MAEVPANAAKDSRIILPGRAASLMLLGALNVLGGKVLIAPELQLALVSSEHYRQPDGASIEWLSAINAVALRKI